MKRLTEYLAGEIAAHRIPGAVIAVVHRGRTVLHDAYGYRDPEHRIPMTTDTLFWIASMTKPITTVGALALMEQGRLVLERPIADYLPQFAHWSPQPTILDLLRHTAGMPEGLLGDTPVHREYAEAFGDGMTDLTGDEFVERLSRLPALHEPGRAWHYGYGLDLVGLIIESLVGISLGDYLADTVFSRLRMTDTSFGVPREKAERYAGSLPDLALPDLTRARFHSGGAGLVGTAKDYLRFASMLLDGGWPVLSDKTVEYMLADQLPPGTDTGRLERPGWNPGYTFGLGLAVRRGVGGGATTPGSAGEVTWPGAAGTTWWVDRTEQLGAVVLTHTAARIEPQVRAIVLSELGFGRRRVA